MESNNTEYVVRNYKDTVFRMIFKEKPELLSLYNAINGTSYDNPEELEVTTLENAIYLAMKNDVSCLLDMRLQLYEQQSTASPNMPIRCLMYVTTQYEKLLMKKNLYTSRKIMLPTPRFIVFYNGNDFQPEKKLLRLTDLFSVKEAQPSMELVVEQYNINHGYNEDLKMKCPALWEYIAFTNKIRIYRKEMSLQEAVNKSIDECISENILRDFLLKNKAEVIRLSIFEFDEELYKKTITEEAREDGFAEGHAAGLEAGHAEGHAKGLAEGHAEGHAEGQLKKAQEIARNMKAKNQPYELISEFTGLSIKDIENL